MDTTRPDLAELRRMLAAATPGPWHNDEPYCIEDDSGKMVAGHESYDSGWQGAPKAGDADGREQREEQQ